MVINKDKIELIIKELEIRFKQKSSRRNPSFNEGYVEALNDIEDIFKNKRGSTIRVIKTTKTYEI